ncbi:RHS repeat-associated core domain-containing protein [uncultured Desulfobacter sp.]|uniref:RHS repeat domain-containing protein n=2 Tax=uncultured Desulfobacter sp. TaxID=240139 RepID=UPI0029F56B8A|nr:RHS repeat-associated core domain-containing protein [uncultured Desulfobacter sp.]
MTHTATEVSDEFGSRTATMVFTGDNQAYLQDEEGNDVQELPAITVRATEFATQKSMPSELPANSAFTYCTELQADGAKRVRFKNPVTVWVDNFLGFEVGSAVPVGYYDRDKAQWIPSDNGTVVRLLDTDNDGVIDALDATGDGSADDLNSNGSYDDEVAGLIDTDRYQPGSTFWKFKVSHFTPWDCNWPYGPPEDAVAPNGAAPTTAEDCEDDKCTQSNSYVSNKKRIFHEDIPIPGTGLTLHYTSGRVEGYGHTVIVPASGDTVPTSLESIIVKLTIAGRTFEEELPAEANRSVGFTWDGLDHLGNRMEGETTGTVRIGFVYGGVYYSSNNNFGQAFAQAGDEVTGIRARQEVTSWKKYQVTFKSALNTGFGNGWSLSNHHRLIQEDVLFKGNGATESVTARRLDMITTVAGTGNFGYSGDNGPATEAELKSPTGVAFDASGNMYISSTNHVVRKIAPPLLAKASEFSHGDYYVNETDHTAHTFSSSGYHLSTINLHTGKALTTFTYDDDNLLISIVDRFDNTITIDRDSAGNPTAINAPFGQRTELSVDIDGNLTEIQFEDGSSYGFGYTSDGLMTTMTDPRDLTSIHIFDENGRVIRTTDQENGTWTFERETYDDGSALSTVTSGENNATTHLDSDVSDGSYRSVTTYPGGDTRTYVLGNQNLDESVESCGMTTQTRYTIDAKSQRKIPATVSTSTPAGLMSEMTLEKTYEEDDDGFTETATTTIDRNGAATTVKTDYLTGTTTAVSPESRTVTSLFDLDTLLTTQTQVTGLNAIEYFYDDYGRPASVTSGSRTSTYTYNSRGNLNTVVDPLGLTTSYSYDLLDRVTRIENPDYTVTEFQYDEKGNMTMLTTPVPADHTFEYNGVNKVSSFITPQNSVTTYTYDTKRKLTNIGLPSGKTITNIYLHSRLSRTVTDEWTTDYAYGCMDLVSSITRGSEALFYSYDGTLLTSVSQSGSLNQDIELEYNNDFRPTAMTYAGGTENLDYDADGLLTSSGRFSISRNIGNGLPESVSDGTFSLTRSFNGYGETSGYNFSISGNNAFSLALTRNDGSRITHKTESIEGISSGTAYTYDDRGQLLTVTTDGTLVEEYRYDNNGNRTYEMNRLRDISGKTFSYSNEDHIITAGTAQYTFDLDDRLSSRTDGSETTEYAYSSTGELMQVTMPDGTVITYTNDPLGRRIARAVNGSVKERYLWFGLTTLLAVYDGSGTLYQRFIYADDRMPYAMKMNGSTYYLIYDQVGSLRLITDSAGNTVKRIDYDTFGNVISDSDDSLTIPFGFAGGLHDRDTTLVRFGHRDYMPEIGKWTAKDPILFAGGDTNLYGYVVNNPINMIDPEGLIGKFLFGQFVNRSVRSISNAYLDITLKVV